MRAHVPGRAGPGPAASLVGVGAGVPARPRVVGGRGREPG